LIDGGFDVTARGHKLSYLNFDSRCLSQLLELLTQDRIAWYSGLFRSCCQ
jgi:hypothetical protein